MARGLILVAMLLLGSGLGFVIGRGAAPPPESLGLNAGESKINATGDSGSSPEDPALLAARRKAADANDALAKANEKIEALLAEVARLTTALKDAEAAAAAKAVPAVSVTDTLQKIEALRGNGMAAFLAPGATNVLVADLRALGKEGLDLLRGLLKSENPEDRLLAAKLMEDLADPQSISDLLTTTLEDQDEKVANMASHALALMGGGDALDALRKIVAETKQDGAKVNALFGLAKAGDENGIQQSLAFLKDSEQPAGMRNALVGGLLILDDPRVMPHVDYAATAFRSSAPAMGMVISYYKRIGGPDATSRLQQLAGDPALAQEIRDAAAAALNQ